MEQKLRPWRIKKGRFSANPLLRLWHALPRWVVKKTRWEFEFELGEDAWWYPVPGKSDHIQKIAGVSFGLNHHKNSMRLGFVPARTRAVFHLYAYPYVDGKAPAPRHGEYDGRFYLGSVGHGSRISASILCREGSVIISVHPSWNLSTFNSSSKSFPMKPSRFFRLLSPYIEFGPGEGAPQDMTIYLSKIKAI